MISGDFCNVSSADQESALGEGSFYHSLLTYKVFVSLWNSVDQDFLAFPVLC